VLDEAAETEEERAMVDHVYARLVNKATSFSPDVEYDAERVARAVAKDNADLRKLIGELVELHVKRLVDSQVFLPQSAADVPNDPLSVEHRSFYKALDAWTKHIENTGDRDDFRNLRPHARRKAYNWPKWLKAAHDDFPLHTLTLTKIQEMVAYWRNRPTTRYDQRCSVDHASRMIQGLFNILNFLDAAPDWKWDIPRGVQTIKRTPVTLEADFVAKRARRISASIYTVDQLAIIARSLDRYGKMVLGLAINCGMGPAEFGRVEIGDCFINQRHPDADLSGIHDVATWVMFDRRKTGEYGEWKLWPPVAFLVAWAIERSQSLGASRLAVRDNGKPWYSDSAKNGSIHIGKWWQGDPGHSVKGKKYGIVTKLADEIDGFPRLTVKTLRKVLPNTIRTQLDVKSDKKELAQLAIMHTISRSAMIDRYSDRPYAQLHRALDQLADHFAPLLDALSSD
jgi:hypothetical protein